MAERTKRIYIRVTEEELAGITEKAERSNLSISDYVRRAALNKRVMEFDAASFQQIITELRTAGITLRELLKEVRSDARIDPKYLEEAVSANRETETRAVDAFTKLWR